MKVIQDIVLNHTCNWGEENLNVLGGSQLQTQISSDIYSTRNQVVMNGTGDPNNIYHHNGFCGGGDWDNFEAQRKTIADDCFDLNTENPTVYNYLVDCYTKYINMGVDAFRVDTVKHISRLTLNSVFVPAFKKAGGDEFYMFGEVCTKGHDVWYRGNPPISTCFYTWADDATWLGKWSSTDQAANNTLVEEHYNAHCDTGSQPTSDNAFLNGNVYHTPDYSKRSGMDAIDFQMHWSFNNANDAFNTALGEDQYFNDSTWNVVYVDSHDYGPDQAQTMRYNGGTDAWAENLSLMFTFRGIPCVYYGSEIEFQAGKPIDVGPNAKLSETGRAYYGDNIEGTVTSSDFTVFGNVSGTVADTLNAPLSQHIMRLNRLRQAIPALRKGQYSTQGCSGNIAFKRRYTDSTTDSFALVAISGDATFSGIPNGTYTDAVTGDVKTVTNGTLTASVSGKGNMKIYVLSTSKTPAPGRVIPNGKYLTDGGSVEAIGPVSVKVVNPTSITLDKASVSVMEANTAKVTATIAPSDVTNKTVTWSTSNASVATVSGGTITGVSQGTATITAKTANGLSATAKVTVTNNPNIVKPTGVKLNKSSITVLERKTETLTAAVSPSNATNTAVNWSSSNSSVATVDSNGVVTGVRAGTATITVTTAVGGYTATCTVTVEKNNNLTRLYFRNTDNWSSVNAYAWDSTASPVVSNKDWPGVAMTAASESGVYYIELDSGYDHVIFNAGSNGAKTNDLTLGNDGQIYDFSKGTWSEYGSTTNVSVTGVSLNKTSATVAVNGTASLTANVAPSNASNKSVTWKSSNTSVATVNNSGIVIGKKAGTATITVTTVDGDYTATCTITVSGEVDQTTKRIYFKNTSGWSTVNAYIWKNGTTTSVAEWPGTTMNLFDAAEKLYYIDVDTNVGYNMIIFNNGGDKTDDLSIPASNSNMYTYSTGNWSEYVIEEPEPEKLEVSLSTSTSKAVVGDKITLTGSATGGSGSYTYSYIVYNKTTGQWGRIADNVSSTALTWTAGSTGDREFYVDVKDSEGTVVRSAAVSVSVSSNTSTLSVKATADKTSAAVGSKVTFTAAASGGSGKYTYSLIVYNKTTGQWGRVADNVSSSTLTWTAGSAGTRQFYVDVKDSTGKIVRSAAVNVTTSSDTNALKVSATVDKSSASVGSTVKFTTSASGGSGSYKYSLIVYNKTTGQWARIADNVSSSTFTWTAGSAGDREFYIDVKDSTGKIVRSAALKVVTASDANALKVSATASSSKVSVGSKVTFTASASGGSGKYTYSLIVYNKTTGQWARIADNVSSSAFTWTAGSTGTRQFYIDVKDSTGKIVRSAALNITT